MDQQRPDQPGGPGVEQDLGRISAFDEAPERRAGERDLPGMAAGPQRREPEGHTMPAPRPTISGRDTESRSGGQGGRDTGRQGGGVMDDVKSRADSMLGDGKARLADQISSFGRALDDASRRLEGDAGPVAGYARQAAEQVNRAGDYLKRADPSQLARDVQEFARRRPELFLGGLVIAGVLVARFLRASGQGHSTMGRSMDRDERGGQGRIDAGMQRDRMDQDRQPGGRAGPPGQTFGDREEEMTRTLADQASGGSLSGSRQHGRQGQQGSQTGSQQGTRSAGDQGGPGNAPGTSDPRVGRRGFEGDSGGA